MRPRALFVIAVGGALGSPARYAVSQSIHVAPDSFPWATFVTNLSGAFVLGVFLTFVLERQPPSRWHHLRLFFAVGFLGAFTTFSTMAVETVLLVKDGFVALGVGYMLVSVAAGLAVAYLGIALGAVAPAPGGDVVLVLGIALAGAVGAPARYLVDIVVIERSDDGLSLGTFVVNVTGSFILGFLTGLALYHAFPSTPRTILGTGFCGAYTTFSTFAYEIVRLAEVGARRSALRMLIGSLVVPALAAALGLALAAL